MQSIWLSHPLDNETPLYGGDDKILIQPDKSIARGDSCNTTFLKLPAHTGSHVDAPAHFIANGRTLSDYPAEDWIFNHPLVVMVTAVAGQLIGPGDLSGIEDAAGDTDLLLIRTGFENLRANPIYWQKSPGVVPEAAGFLRAHLPGLKAIGFDFISISSLAHRETGREAHRAFLGEGIRIFEDLSLAGLDKASPLVRVIALPLRIKGGDGAPCTVIGFM